MNWYVWLAALIVICGTVVAIAHITSTREPFTLPDWDDDRADLALCVDHYEALRYEWRTTGRTPPPWVPPADLLDERREIWRG